jgi:drug/metabolite transporter (DMT)-like permease
MSSRSCSLRRPTGSNTTESPGDVITRKDQIGIETSQRRSSVGNSNVALIASLGLIWGFTFLFIKVSVEGLSPLWLVSVRTLSGLLVLVVALLVRRVPLPRGKTLWLHIAFLAVPANVAPWALVAWAQQEVTSAMTAVLYSLIPLMTLLIAASLTIESLTMRKTAGLVLASGGTAVIVGFQGDNAGNVGMVLVILFACALLAAGAVYAKRFVTSRVTALPMVTIQLAMAFLVSTPLALIADGPPQWGQLTAAVLGASLTLGAVGTGLAFLIYYTLIERVGATNATMITYITPIIGVLAGGLILDEPVTTSLLVGGVAIVFGVWIAQSARRGPIESVGA